MRHITVAGSRALKAAPESGKTGESEVRKTACMEPTLTEFSYGYCVTEEFANGAGPGLKAAPYFPSLYSEGQEGGGYDVRIGSALFLQFKLTDELRRRSARETQEGLLEPPFFRFWLHRRNRSSQHRMLIELEQQPGSQVYYIAPAFSDLDGLDAAYTSESVVQQSALFSPGDIGPLSDDVGHRVSFRADQNWGWFLSEPKQIPKRAREEIFSSALDHPKAHNISELSEWLNQVAREMRRIVREEQGALYQSEYAEVVRRRDPLQEVAYLARTHYGAEFFFVAEPSP
jgi:hypothetical protein